jgi:hypothetical protein
MNTSQQSSQSAPRKTIPIFAPILLTPIHSEELLHSLRNLFAVQITPQYYDTIFEVQQRGKEAINIYLTRAILHVTCPFLAQLLLQEEERLSGTNILRIVIRDVDQEVFSQIIEYCFTGDLSSTDIEILNGVIEYANRINFDKVCVKAEGRIVLLKRLMETPKTSSLDKMMNEQLKGKKRKSLPSASPSSTPIFTPPPKRRRTIPRKSTSPETASPVQSTPQTQTPTVKIEEKRSSPPAPAQTEQDESKMENFIEFKVGEKVLCKYEDQLFLCKIVSIRETDDGKDECKVHYYGYCGYDEWVDMNRLYKDTPDSRRLKEELDKKAMESEEERPVKGRKKAT